MARADVSARAQADYDEIIDYVARDKPQAALRLSKTLQAKIELLAQRPLLGDRRPELASELRSATVGRYVIYYRPVSEGIEVVRILAGERDVRSQFNDSDRG